MYVCVCNAVTETQLRECVAEGAQTLEDLQLAIGIATCCGTCADAACGYLGQGAQASGERCVPAPAARQPAPAPAAPRVRPDFAPVRWVSRAPQAHILAKAA